MIDIPSLVSVLTFLVFYFVFYDYVHGTSLITLTIISCIIYYVIVHMFRRSFPSTLSNYNAIQCLSTSIKAYHKKNFYYDALLLVTAHPDDESMFFTPLLLNALQKDHEIYILCLTTGNADGLGKLREKELIKCCGDNFQIPPQNVFIIDDPSLPDGMTMDWNLSVAEKYIIDKIVDISRRHPNIEVVTFDEGGISGHINHKQTHQATSNAVSEYKNNYLKKYHDNNQFKKRTSGIHVRLWNLSTLPLYQKYTFWLGTILYFLSDFFFSEDDNSIIFTSPYSGIITWNSMVSHASQFVWYRRLFVPLSIYSYMSPIKPVS